MFYMYDGHNICYTIFGGTIRHATINLSINDWLFKSAGGYSIKKNIHKINFRNDKVNYEYLHYCYVINK